MSTRAPVVGLAALMCVLAAAFAAAFSLTDASDYANPFCGHNRCNDAAPAIDALQHGHVGRFFDEQPAMGSFSLLVRAPAALAARVAGGGETWQYRAGALACLLAAVALGVALALRLLAHGHRFVAWLPLGLLCVFNPANGDALQRGHPEEILGAALLAGAALVAGARPVGAGVLAGLAIATKQWALLGLLPVAFVAPAGQRARVVAVAAGVALLLALPMALGNPGAFRDATRAAANPPGTVKPLDIWFPFAGKHNVTLRLPDGSRSSGQVWALPRSADRAAHWLVVAAAAALIALWWRRRERAGPALYLLALLLLLRVVGDPRAHPYHHAPFVLALACTEAALLARFPWRTLGASALLAVTLRLFDSGPWSAANAVYLAWALPALALLAAGAFNAKNPAKAGFLGARVMGDPGFEPGTSSLSETRSNRLS